MALLEVRDLKMYYKTLRGYVKAVDSVSFDIKKGKALGIAGESGCGKTSMATTILRLLPDNAKLHGGSIKLDGIDILKLTDKELRESIRWKRIAMIFQGAMNALNPVHRIGDQIIEAILAHENISLKDAITRTKELLGMVGINPKRYREYPHEFSGGMKQRVVIAMALACNPDLIIADEPTTALDVMVQSQVLKAMEDLRQRLNLSMMLITHDLSVIAQTCDDIALMYAGKIVEYGAVADIYDNPIHPYATGLVRSFPNIQAERQQVKSLPGFPPNLLMPPEGCRFHPRCPLMEEICMQREPELIEVGPNNHKVACHKVDTLKKGVGIWQ